MRRRAKVLWSNAIHRRVAVEVLLEPRDCWVGVYWTPSENPWKERYWEVYVCIVPCLPVRFFWHRHILPFWKRQALRLRGDQ